MARYVIDNTPQDIDFECGGDLTARTLQNCKNLLMTRKGEVPFDRLRGFDARLYDLPLPELNERIVREMDRVMEWEPDAEVVDAEARMTENGDTIITVTLELSVEEG